MEIVVPLCCLPSVPMFSRMVHASDVLIEVNDSYKKQTCRNRFSVDGPEGKMTLSIPVIKVNGNNTKTHDIALDNRQSWNIRIWRGIESSYNKSPYFLYYRDAFEEIFLDPGTRLVAFNLRLLELCYKLLKTAPNYRTTETYLHTYDDRSDLRNFGIDIPAELPPYMQVFSDKHAFIPGLSIIDLLFGMGPQAKEYLRSISPF